jgi:hypothetical protein
MNIELTQKSEDKLPRMECHGGGGETRDFNSKLLITQL